MLGMIWLVAAVGALGLMLLGWAFWWEPSRVSVKAL